jgi:hypothetical protein
MGDGNNNEGGGLSEAAILELKSRYPGVELRSVKPPSGARIVLRAPDKGIYGAWQSDLVNPKKERMPSTEAYVLRCVAYPSAEVVAQMFEKQPALSNQLAIELNEMAGVDADLDVKKL